MSLAADISTNLARVQEQIVQAAARSRRDPAAVRLVAVTKTFFEEIVLVSYDV
jgi:uncharacterized pyridoxal phosphate-containing UPF0001 family protein